MTFDISTYKNLLSNIIRKRKVYEENISDNGPTEVVKDIVKNVKLDDTLDREVVRLYSNDIANACKTVCKICKKTFTLNLMRHHTKSIHKMPIKEYRSVYGNFREDIVEPVYHHKCGICSKDMLLDFDDIHQHTMVVHKLSLKEYNTRFIVRSLKKDKTKKKVTYATGDLSFRSKYLCCTW